MPVDPSGETIWGTPGETWKNDTGEIWYQLDCNWANTCGLCAQYDGAVKKGSWPIPYHRGCRCRQTPILPGREAPRPFTDFVATIAGLDPAQQKEVVGVSNWRLIESGTVSWEDVVSPSRVRDLSEVVATRGLTLDAMLAAGVKPSVAERAFEAVHTPEHALIEARRKELIADLKGAGLSAKDIAKLASEGLAGRVIMGTGVSGAPTPTSPTGIDTVLLARILAGARPTPTPPPTPPPVATKATVVVEDGAEDKTLAALGKLLGPGATPELAATLAGAPEGTTATVSPGSLPGSVVVDVVADGVHIRRMISLVDGKPAVQNVLFELSPAMQGKGIGTEVLAMQIAAARANGVAKITLAAAGSPDDPDMVGYKVWPKLGFDGPLPPRILDELPGKFAGAKRLSDLYATPAGRAWWEGHGTTIGLSFDPTPGSYSSKVWDAYLAAR